ncbi:MAG: EfeM/EfeO family lipoprotein, partial [Gordonia sp. (in: high G+C Gram-positive bacteria)]
IAKVADQLVADVKTLRDEVSAPNFEFETQMFIRGPQALIDEIAKTKVSGEEDRYSHTDLWDIAANIEGSETLIAELAPIITSRNKGLMDKITAQFGDVKTFLEQFREGEGYASYTTVTPEQRRELSDKIDALSATLSQVPGIVMAE